MSPNLKLAQPLVRAFLLVAMRLHASILAASALTPISGLAYQPKVRFFYNSLGLGKHCLDFDQFTADHLARQVLRGWSEREGTRAVLRDRIPELQREARKPAELVAALRRGEDLDAAFARVCDETGR